MKSPNKTSRLAAILVYLATIAVAAAAAPASEVDDHSEGKTGADPDAHAYGSDPHGAGEGGGGDHGSHPVTAILFPWFAEIIGVLVFFVLSVSAAFILTSFRILRNENRSLYGAFFINYR